ncbi:MAG TPA: hypothetical protein VIS03_06350 [Kiloniellaceae bacterium]
MDRPSPTAQVLGSARRKHRPTATQLAWLSRGLAQAGGKLPLFDRYGQRHDIRTIRSCIEQGWAEPWFKNPIKPDWLVCRLTDEGRALAEAGEATADDEDDSEREHRVRSLVDDLFC